MAKDPEQSTGLDILATDFNWYGAASGGTAYAVSMNGVGTAYNAGRLLVFKTGSASVGTATLNINSIGAKNIKVWDFGGLRDLVANELLASQYAVVTYDATNDCFVLTNPAHENARVARGTISDNNNVTTSSGGGSNTDTVVSHGLGITPKLVTISCEITADGSSNSSIVKGVVAYDANANVAWANWEGWNQSGSLSRSGWLRSTSANMNATGVGGFNETITVSVLSIGASSFTFRINGVDNGGSVTSTVKNICWTAIA